MAKHVSGDDVARLEDGIKTAQLRQGLHLRDIARLCPPDTRRETLTRWLHRLVVEGRLFVSGRGKGTRYSLLPPDGSAPAAEVSPTAGAVAPAGGVSQSAPPAGLYPGVDPALERRLLEAAAVAYEQMAKVGTGQAMDDWTKQIAAPAAVPVARQKPGKVKRSRSTVSGSAKSEVHSSRSTVVSSSQASAAPSPSSDICPLTSDVKVPTPTSALPASDSPASVTPPAAEQPSGPGEVHGSRSTVSGSAKGVSKSPSSERPASSSELQSDASDLPAPSSKLPATPTPTQTVVTPALADALTSHLSSVLGTPSSDKDIVQAMTAKWTESDHPLVRLLNKVIG